MRLALTGAWYAGMLGRLKDPPSLATLLGEKPAAPTPAQIEATFDAWERATADGGAQ